MVLEHANFTGKLSQKQAKPLIIFSLYPITMNLDPSKICFGLTDDLDRQSFISFLGLAGQQELAELLAARMSSDEILQVVDTFFLLFKKHLSKDEYHRYFLHESHHHHNKE